jgi:hypothetical protein
MGAKDEILIVKNIDGVDESLTCENVDTYSFNMGNVHLQHGNLLEMKYHNLQLYKLNLYFGNHKIEVQFVEVFFCYE